MDETSLYQPADGMNQILSHKPIVAATHQCSAMGGDTGPFCFSLPRAAQADDRTLGSLGWTSGLGSHPPTLLKQECTLGSRGGQVAPTLQ